MDTSRVDKKVREAEFFLANMRKVKPIGLRPSERFDFYLSAFLNAARTIDYRLRHEHPALYNPWRRTWDANQAAGEQRLIKYLVDDRNVEVHASGSNMSAKKIKGRFNVGRHAHPAGGTLVVLGGPATIRETVYVFSIDGSEREVTQACEEYLALLRGMVERFKADHP